MSMHFRDLAVQTATVHAISPDEILMLRRAGWADGKIEPEEADAIFDINDHLAEPSPEWTAFFVEALSDYLLNSTEPRGYVSEEHGHWLIDRIDRDGRLESMAELELLIKVLDRAFNTPDRLKSFALAQIELAVLTGTGPTRDGGSLDPGRISDAEVHLLRRMIFAQAGDRPAAVSCVEAEMLFRLKDATLGADNSPEWKRLFVQGVGNYLAGYSSYTALPRERAAELELFMQDSHSSIGRFLGRMAKGAVQGEPRKVFGRKQVARDLEAEVAAAAVITQSEQSWLQGHIDADGRVDEFEQALIDFLAEEKG